jgi:hypothetical protein
MVWVRLQGLVRGNGAGHDTQPFIHTLYSLRRWMTATNNIRSGPHAYIMWERSPRHVTLATGFHIPTTSMQGGNFSDHDLHSVFLAHFPALADFFWGGAIGVADPPFGQRTVFLLRHHVLLLLLLEATLKWSRYLLL